MSSDRLRRATVALVLLAPLTLWLGCGKQGAPAPRPRTIPQPAKDLTVRQRGMEFLLEFSYPASTVAGLPLPGLESATVYELQRTAPPPGTAVKVVETDLDALAKPVLELTGADLDAAVAGGKIRIRLPVTLPTAPAAAAALPVPAATTPPAAATKTPGEATLSTSAAPSTTASLPQATIFAVRTKATKGDISPWSNGVGLVPTPPPPAPDNLVVEARRAGIALSWSRVTVANGYAIYRRSATEPGWGTHPLVTLTCDSADFFDSSAVYGNRYIYTVLTLASMEPPIESTPTVEREVDYRDIFPPAPPSELHAVVLGNEVQLVWEGSPDSDLAGYLIERAEGSGKFHRLNATPVLAQEQTDRGAPRGIELHYRVLAVDRAGNFSPPSKPAQTLLR